ncbi:hypothetical protein Tco_0356146 [Tanacetum coccineum]
MDDPNMTMEEYIKFEEEKARRHGRVFDWKTATYGKIRVDDDLYDLRSMEAEFLNPNNLPLFDDDKTKNVLVRSFLRAEKVEIIDLPE